MYKPRDIIELIAGNVKKTGNPFGASSRVINGWWKNVPLPREGDGLLFTGLMYQSVPFIEKTTTYLERYEDAALGKYVKYGRFVPKLLVGWGFALLASKEEKRKFNAFPKY